MAKPPNLLFIFTDQHRYDVMGSRGTPQVRTPNLDALAAESAVFDQTYCTQPVCIPSRGSLMTGLWPHQHMAVNNFANLPIHIPCLPELLSGDPATAYFGKWDLGDEIFAQHGFDHWISTEDCYARRHALHRDPSQRSSYHHFLLSQGYEPADGSRFTRWETAALPESVSKPKYLADKVTQWLKAHRDQPFVACVNFLEPHSPNYGPRDDAHDPADVSLPANFDPPPGASCHPWARHLADEHRERGIILDHGIGDQSTTPLRDADAWRRLIAQYWGLVELVDAHLGRILQSVRDLSLWDNTIIVYTSDHGEMLGSHRLTNKDLIFEESSRVPMMIKPAHSSSGVTVDGPFSHIDLVPTLLELMGEAIPRHLPGISRAAATYGKSPQLTDDVFMQWHAGPYGAWRSGDTDVARAFTDTWRMIVTADGWKFNFSPNGWHELYDLNSDPLETHNLACDAQQAGRVNTLKRRVIAWMETVQDPMRFKFSS